MAGKLDCLREPGYTEISCRKFRAHRCMCSSSAGHMGNIECADEFNERVLAFLAEQKVAA